MKRKKCKDKTGWNNEIILESGEDIINSLHAMFNKMEQDRVTPAHILMDNKRGLFITDTVSKVYERIEKTETACRQEITCPTTR